MEVRRVSEPRDEDSGLAEEMLRRSFSLYSVAVVDPRNDTPVAHWGEIMSTTARGFGCIGGG